MIRHDFRRQSTVATAMARLTWLSLFAMITPAIGRAAADPYKEVLSYKHGQPRAALAAIEAEIRAAKPDELPGIETKLLEILQTPAATGDCKDWACRQLRQAGSERAAEVLAPFLADRNLNTVARLALQSIPGAKVDQVLRNALPNLQGDLKAGVMITLGVRGDRRAVPLLTPLASDLDESVAEAALFALGHIGGGEALRALEAARVPEKLKRYRFHAILLCAERLAGEGKATEAEAVYQSVYKRTADGVIRIGALRGILLCGKENAAPSVVAALRDANPELRAAAVKFTCELGGSELIQAVLDDLGSLLSETKVLFFGMVNDKAALPALMQAARSGDENIRTAALNAMGRVGDASAVSPLLKVAAEEGGAVQAAARRSLGQLHGEEIEKVLMAAAQGGQVAERIEAMRALAARGSSEAIGLLLKSVRDPEPRIQAGALGALSQVADAKSLPALVSLMVEAKGESQQAAVENAVMATCRRMDDKDAAARAVIAALAGQPAGIRVSLLRMLKAAACPRAMEALQKALEDSDPNVQEIAIKVLSEWPDPAALGELVAVIRSARSPEHKALALRGLARLAALPGGVPVEGKVQCLSEAMKLVSSSDEKKMILAALAAIDHPRALDLAVSCLGDEDLEVDAALAVVKIAKTVRKTNPEAAGAAIQKILVVCRSPTARQIAESSSFVPGDMKNIASQGTALSPDGLEKDGASSGDQAAIDGDPNTYWDEEDGKALYRLAVAFPQPKKVAALSIMGYEHHRFAPKDFEILCDGVLVKKVENAQYDSNFLVIRLEPVTLSSLELKITGYYGGSPAIRELGIYRRIPKK